MKIVVAIAAADTVDSGTMKRSYAPPCSWKDRSVELDPAESHHLVAVRRTVIGDEVIVFDGQGREARARVAGIGSGTATLEILDVSTRDSRGCDIILVQALIKSRGMDLSVEKATELGVRTIIPVDASRSVPVLTPGAAGKRVARWLRIAESSVKQCGGVYVPEIRPVTTFEDALAECSSIGAVLIPTLAPGTTSLRNALKDIRGGRLAVFIGPEGDWTADEVARVTDAGGTAVSFGDRVLRAETAAMFALSVIGYVLGGPAD